MSIQDLMGVGHAIARSLDDHPDLRSTGSGGSTDGSMYEVHINTPAGPVTATIRYDHAFDDTADEAVCTRDCPAEAPHAPWGPPPVKAGRWA